MAGVSGMMKPLSMSNNGFSMNTKKKEKFEEDDEVSMQFSVDPRMYDKLGILKSKIGEQNKYDQEKLYRYQLEKDKKKINDVKGTYKSRAQKFVEWRRKTDPVFRQVDTTRPIGKHGLFGELDTLTMEERWKSTSQPYGIIAHKRYLEYLSKLPPGPNELYLLDKEQRELDAGLHDDNKHGRLEETKKMKKAKLYKEFLEEEARQKALTEVDIFKEKRVRDDILDRQQFAEFRKYPTKRQARQSLQGWHKGKF